MKLIFIITKNYLYIILKNSNYINLINNIIKLMRKAQENFLFFVMDLNLKIF